MNLKAFLEKYEFLIPTGLFFVFLAFTLPGITWGAPYIWHPDEIVLRSIKALHGEWKFGEINFDYPDLPQYVMFWLGRIVLALGYTDNEVLIASRVLSAVLAGLSIVITYLMIRRMKGNLYVAALGGFLLICVTLMPHNARFAHNDTYITLFTVLTVLFLINYQITQQRGWLYLSFLTVGMAASSKYNGIALVIVPVLIYLANQRKNLFQFRTVEILFIGGLLTVAGFVVGTPQALTSMEFYFSNMIPALLHAGNYSRQPDSVRGIIGQYPVMVEALGLFLFLLFAAGFIWAIVQLVAKGLYSNTADHVQTKLLVIPVLAILAMDLPIMLSYNYQPRFFLPLMPLLATLTAFFVGYLYACAQQRNVWLVRTLSMALVIMGVYYLARNISVMLLFMNDARFAASNYVSSLPGRTNLEHTLYPPLIPEKHFRRARNYPIYFVKVPGDPIPTSENYVFNAGEIGLDERQTDYFITDSFTYDRFSDSYICASMQVECDFFKQLNTGQSNHYKLVAEFSYSLPRWLPQLQVQFVNPVIRVYQRIE